MMQSAWSRVEIDLLLAFGQLVLKKETRQNNIVLAFVSIKPVLALVVTNLYMIDFPYDISLNFSFTFNRTK